MDKSVGARWWAWTLERTPMTDVGKRMKKAADPVLLEFGTTMYICQMFESSLCFLLALLAEHRAPSDGAAFQASWDFHSEKTLGGLVTALRKQIEIPSNFDKFLREGTDLRNKVVHGYLTSNIVRLMDPKGRLELLRELREFKADIKKRDVEVNHIIDALLAKYGLSNEQLKQNAAHHWEWLNAHTSDEKH